MPLTVSPAAQQIDLKATQSRDDLVSTPSCQLDQTQNPHEVSHRELRIFFFKQHYLNTTSLHHENKMVGQLPELRCTNTVVVGWGASHLLKER